MPNDKPGWDDEEQTILSFNEAATEPDPQAPPPEDSGPAAPAAPAREDDPEATVVERSQPPAADPWGDQHTVAEEGSRRPAAVERIAWLVLTRTRSVRRGQLYRLESLRTDLGSGAVAISLNDPKVSRSHACIRYEAGDGEGRFVLYDLAATNGTFVNGTRVTAPVALADGDRVGLGDTELVFKQV